MDAVLVESLSRPLEDLERSSKFVIQGDLSQDTSKEMDKMTYAFDEILSRLDTLVVTLEGYESDCRTKFIINLKTSLVAAVEEISRSSYGMVKNLDPNSTLLSELILDPLVDAQTSVNAVLHDVEKIKHPQTSELALSLAELRDAVSYVVQKTMTSPKDAIGSLINLKEPLIDLQLSLAVDRAPEELETIKNITSPLDSLENVIQIVMQNVEKSEFHNEILNTMKPIQTVIEELKRHIPVVMNVIEDKTNNRIEIIEEKSPVQQKVDKLQVASELGIVHFELAVILEKCEKVMKNVPMSSRVFESVNDLRQAVGNAAIVIDKISTSIEPNIENFVDELINLKEPLLELQNVLLIEDSSTLQEQKIIIEVIEPIER